METKKSVVKGIVDRGWNPLNYNVLTILPDAKVVVDLTSKDTTTSSSVIAVPAPIATVPALNLTQGVGTYYLDMLIEEGKKDEGRQKSLRQLRRSKRQINRR